MKQRAIIMYTSCFHALTPKSDKHVISPYNVTPESYVEVTRIKGMVTS